MFNRIFEKKKNKSDKHVQTPLFNELDNSRLVKWQEIIMRLHVHDYQQFGLLLHSPQLDTCGFRLILMTFFRVYLPLSNYN